MADRCSWGKQRQRCSQQNEPHVHNIIFHSDDAVRVTILVTATDSLATLMHARQVLAVTSY